MVIVVPVMIVVVIPVVIIVAVMIVVFIVLASLVSFRQVHRDTREENYGQ